MIPPSNVAILPKPWFPKPLRVAVKMAENSTYKQRLGACLVKSGKIIGKGFNRLRHHKFSFSYPYLHQYHAECGALLHSPTSCIMGSSLFVARINRMGITRLAKPCSSCMSLLRDHGIRQVTYTTNEGSYETISIRD